MAEPWEILPEQRELLKRRFGFDDTALDELEQKQKAEFEADVEADKEAERERYLRFGLEHECTCTEDVAAGKLAVVPNCTVRLITDLFNALERVNKERDDVTAELEGKDAEIANLRAELRFLAGDS